MSISSTPDRLRSDVTLIELEEDAVGLAVRDGTGFRVFAAVPDPFRVDSHVFPSLKALRRAVADGRKQSRGSPPLRTSVAEQDPSR